VNGNLGSCILTEWLSLTGDNKTKFEKKKQEKSKSRGKKQEKESHCQPLLFMLDFNKASDWTD